ncbi:MAG TPA: efflux RND transporter periplasmic adaptor subunit [Bacteroidales bacterium]|nr:efflux RND transporter periplasmic adaptor subunit [Bacteroidales bacterium]
MKNSLFILIIVLLITGCGRTRSRVSGTAETRFCIPDSLMSQVWFDTVRVKPVFNELKLLGKITFDQDKVVRIYPLVSGVVTEVRVSLGTYVQKGQVLAVIRSSEMASAENDLNTAKANLQTSEKSFAADSDLYHSGILSEKEFTASRNELEKAKSEFRRASTILSIYGSGTQSDYIVKAPVSGFIVEKFVNASMQIRPDNSSNLFTISDLRKVWVLANVYESDIASITVDEKVEVSTISYPGKKFYGKIDKIYNVLDPDNKTMKVQIQLANDDYLLKPEMFAAAMVYQETNEKMLAVPSAAVIFERNQYWALVYRNKCDVETRLLDVVSSNSSETYVRSGLNNGDAVIVNRQLLIYNALNQ